MNPFTENSAETLKRLNANPNLGLNDAQVEENRSRYGSNSFTEAKKQSLGRKIFESSKEPMILLLIFAAFITLAVNIIKYFTGGHTDFLECVGIFIAIFLSVFITVLMEGRSEKAFEALKQINDNMTVKVIRNGNPVMIQQKDLVVGDILVVETGDRITADGRLIESQSLSADESALTGESLPVNKDPEFVCPNEKTAVADRINMLYSGCFITTGSGKMVVTAVGDETEFGKIARELSATHNDSTPLQEKMAGLSKKITILGASAAALIFVIQIVMSVMDGTISLNSVMETFITSIVLIVAAVPEGLPTIVAISLAINVIKMAKQNALVKKMIACETIGCTNVICSDKTGTLTENKMTVIDIFCDDEIFKPEALQNRYMLENFCINGTADIRSDSGSYEFIGNPTECALLAAADKAGINYKDTREKVAVEHVYPFSSDTKNMTTVIGFDGGQVVYTKGSPEKIIAMCDIDAKRKAIIEAEIIKYQEKSFRIIGFAHKAQEAVSDFENNRAEIESNLTFDGFVAITDPIRADVFDAVSKCKHAGIELKMLTGDNIITAKAIAGELGILDGKHIAVEAKFIEEMSDEELKKKIPEIAVIARSTPTVKMRVVKALKENGNVVAVTGDGINDAPAIKNADVGIAMGITGTEVSKQASDIVLLDDSFSTIVNAVRWGRGIYENFQRFIKFQLTVNLSSVIVVLASILAGFAAPFTALQLLWINIIMDGPPALALGLEPITDDLMERKPTKRDASIVGGKMVSGIVVNGLYISLIFMLQHFTNFLGVPAEAEPTVLFTMFVLFQLFNAFNSRNLTNGSIFRNIGNNKTMLGIFALTFVLQFVITEFGGAFFATVPLSLITWVKIIGMSFTVIILSEIIKLFKRLGAK